PRWARPWQRDARPSSPGACRAGVTRARRRRWTAHSSEMTGPENPRRRIRTFVRREGRLTPGQARALEKWLPEYGIPEDDRTQDHAALFGRVAPVLLEIGFGNGDALLEMAAQHPEWNFIGIEVHRPGVARLLM